MGKIIRTHSIHCYADDKQLYSSMRPGETHQLANLQLYLKDIKMSLKMSHNFLMLNSDKTEGIRLGPKHIRDSLSSNIVNLHVITLASNTSVRNLGVIFDQELSFNSHVKQISNDCLLSPP